MQIKKNRMLLIRYLLVGLIVYLIVRAFVKYGNGDEGQTPRGGSGNVSKPSAKRISKKTGEYIDYEELPK